METRAPYALIGLFVLAAIGAVFGFVYWLNNSGGLSERAVYRVRFENTVSGLLTGAAVLFNGIRVGEVEGLSLDAADPLPGYECFGGPGWAGAIELGAAAVGSLPKPFPNGSGAPIPAGTRYVVQVHYNFDNARGPNRIAVQAWSAPTLTQIPHGLSTANYTFFIPAGAVGVTAFDAAETGPVPDEFDGVTVKVYGVPLVRPLTVAVVGAGFPVTVTGVCAVVPMYGMTL